MPNQPDPARPLLPSSLPRTLYCSATRAVTIERTQLYRTSRWVWNCCHASSITLSRSHSDVLFCFHCQTSNLTFVHLPECWWIRWISLDVASYWAVRPVSFRLVGSAFRGVFNDPTLGPIFFHCQADNLTIFQSYKTLSRQRCKYRGGYPESQPTWSEETDGES
jgi:hypothetical protein